MRKIMVTLVVVVGVIVLMNLSQVGNALADETSCMACKEKVKAYCNSKPKITPDQRQQLITELTLVNYL